MVYKNAGKKQDAKLCDPNVDVRVFYTPLHGHRRKEKKIVKRQTKMLAVVPSGW